MNEGDLLLRIAQTLKNEIGPAVGDEYPRTQAFMAAVVLQKMGQQLALAGAHASAEASDLNALIADLERTAVGTAPPEVKAAISGLRVTRDSTALCVLIASLYAQRQALGEASFSHLLGRVRQTLRANLDRRIGYAA
jgi:hypothetical protein